MSDVSVVMATYNGGRFIKQQLESLAAQTLLPKELIVSDDGSSDETIALVEQFASGAPFPVHIRVNSVRLGYSQNFLNATKSATGTYLAFCDQDDIWYSQKLAKAIAVMSDQKVMLCVHTAYFIDSRSDNKGFFSQTIGRDQCCPPNTLRPWHTYGGFSCVFRRDLLDLIDFDLRGTEFSGTGRPLGHDAWICFLASSFGWIFTMLEPLVGYRQHGANASGSYRYKFRRRLSAKFGAASHPALKRETIAQHRAELLRKSAASFRDSRLAGRALLAADYWERIARLECNRLDLYRGRAFSKRVRVLLTLIRCGCYRSTEFRSFGFGLLVKDIIVGLLRLRPVKV